jgi:hypothetical protein
LGSVESRINSRAACSTSVRVMVELLFVVQGDFRVTFRLLFVWVVA